MRAFFMGLILFSLCAGAGVSIALGVSVYREGRRRAKAPLLYGGVIKPKRRIRKTPSGIIEVTASCAAEAAEVIAANRGLETAASRS